MTSIDRTAYPQFARVLSARELAEAFTPTGAEVEWARSCTDDEHHLLALVVWLKSYQRLGYFPKLAEVPPPVAAHVRQVLGLAEDEVALRQAAPCAGAQTAGGDLRGGAGVDAGYPAAPSSCWTSQPITSTSPAPKPSKTA